MRPFWQLKSWWPTGARYYRRSMTEKGSPRPDLNRVGIPGPKCDNDIPLASNTPKNLITGHAKKTLLGQSAG